MVASTSAIGGISPGQDQERYVIMVVPAAMPSHMRQVPVGLRVRSDSIQFDADIGARYASGGIEDVSR
jgi:hypothetical protein